MRRGTPCGRLGGASNGIPRRSPMSWIAMRRPTGARCPIGRRPAQWHADRSARRPKPTKLARNAALRTYVEDRLAGVVAAPSHARVHRPGSRRNRRPAKAWSPEQIARRLPIDFPDDQTMHISHEAIYKLFISKAVGLCVVNWRPACEQDGRYGCQGLARAERQRFYPAAGDHDQ